MAVAALKKIVEGDANYDDSCAPSEILLEIFCVDTSISMSRSQHFPYIFGESKLQLCKRIIDRGFALPAHAILHTALVKFNATATLSVPFGPHTPEHVRLAPSLSSRNTKADFCFQTLERSNQG